MARKLDDGSPLPLYQQLQEAIEHDIEHGVYQPGSQIPTEEELSNHYQVSRVTVRRALKELTDAGIISKKQGRGTFLNTPKLTRRVSQTVELLAFADMCKAAGMVAGAIVNKMERVQCTQSEADFLGLTEGDDLLLIQRIRTADGQPIMLENTLLPYDEYVFLKKRDLNDGSIFREIETTLGKQPGGHQRCTLEIARATPSKAKSLSVPLGEPLFLETVYLIDSEGNPFFIAKDYFVGSLYMFDF